MTARAVDVVLAPDGSITSLSVDGLTLPWQFVDVAVEGFSGEADELRLHAERIPPRDTGRLTVTARFDRGSITFTDAHVSIRRQSDVLGDDLVDAQGRVIGDGHCPVNDCPVRAKPGRLMCGPHWQRVPPILRRRVNIAYSDFQDGEITLGELRGVQRQAIAAAAGDDVGTLTP